MRRIRFTIASLLVVVLIAAVGFAALRESSDLWESGVFTLALAALLILILLAVHRTESRQAFWIGFAVFGWIYLGLSLVPSIESRLITSKALTYLDSTVPDRPLVITGTLSFQRTNVPMGNQGGVPVTYVKRVLGGSNSTTENFIRIGHSLFALLAGWIGGLLSRRLWQASRRPQESTAVEVEGTTP